MHMHPICTPMHAQSAVFGIAMTRRSSEKRAHMMHVLMIELMTAELRNCRTLTLGFFRRFLASLVANLEAAHAREARDQHEISKR